MLDTGAVLPVWASNEEHLKDIGAVLVALNQPFGGMTRGSLYRIPLFRCGNLLYPELPVVACRSDLPCQMILSATMFSGLIYEVDDFRHRFNVTIPDTQSHVRKLAIEDRNGKLHVLCTSGESE